jgi:hypothetical protein
LATKYLKENGYILASQIKDAESIGQYHLINFEKSNSQIGENMRVIENF